MSLLTKSKYVIGLSCPRYLWLMFHDLDKIPEPDLGALYQMQQGKQVGQLAKKLFPEGVDLPEETDDFQVNLSKTQELIKGRKVMFEAGILFEDLFARADVLVPVENGAWDIVEVKSSTKVKPEHVHDVSFQKYVFENAGLKIRNCVLVLINNQYHRHKDISVPELFRQENITASVIEVSVGIEKRIRDMLDIVSSKIPPPVRIGRGCTNGVECVSEECWNFLPEGHVFELYLGGKKSYELLEAEVLCIKDIPNAFKLNDKQQIQKNCAKTQTAHINKIGLTKFLNTLHYPLHFLDFETFNPAIPIYEGTKPYQQIPFQFSLHIDNQSNIQHCEFLHNSPSDPREPLLQQLKQAIHPTGSIVVYYKSFEISRLQDLAKAFPQYQEWIESILPRFVDLIDPFKNFDYYNPQQHGSCSIKDVLPAVTGKNYKELAINNGGLASVSYVECVFNKPKNKEQIRKDLLTYCKLDTEGMVMIVNELRKLSQ